MDAFFNAMAPVARLSPESRQAFTQILQHETWPKGHLLLKPGSVCRRLYFIEQGLTRTFYFKDGKDVTDWLSAEGSFAGSMISFLTQVPDRRGIELLEASVLWSFAYHELERLYQASHEIEHLGRLLTNQAYIQVQQRFDDLLFTSATERYHTFLQQQPSLLQRVPLGVIASYLGITQETLSRIRAQH